MKTTATLVSTSRPNMSLTAIATTPASTWNNTTPTTPLPSTIASTWNSTLTAVTSTSTTVTENATVLAYPEEVTSGHMFSYVLIPLGAVALALVMTALVFFMLKKSSRGGGGLGDRAVGRGSRPSQRSKNEVLSSGL